MADTWQETLAAKADEMFAPEPVTAVDANVVAELTADPDKQTIDVAAETTEEITENTGQPEPEEVKPDKPAIDPPQAWPDAMKAQFASLPPDIADFVAKRETETHAKFSQMGRDIAEARPVMDVLKHSQLPEGMSPAQAVEKLLEAQAMLVADPVKGLRAIARSFGVDASKIEAEADNPLYREIAGLKQQISQVKVENQTRAEAETARLTASAQTEVAAWSKGKLHFDEVRQTMAGLVGAGLAADLDAAYRMALVKHGKPMPEQAAAEAKAANDAAAKVKADAAAAEKAKAVKTFVPKPATGKPAPRDPFAEGAMQRRLEEIRARG